MPGLDGVMLTNVVVCGHRLAHKTRSQARWSTAACRHTLEGEIAPASVAASSTSWSALMAFVESHESLKLTTRSGESTRHSPNTTTSHGRHHYRPVPDDIHRLCRAHVLPLVVISSCGVGYQLGVQFVESHGCWPQSSFR